MAETLYFDIEQEPSESQLEFHRKGYLQIFSRIQNNTSLFVDISPCSHSSDLEG